MAIAPFTPVLPELAPEVPDQPGLDIFEVSFAAAPIGMALVSTEGKWLKVNPAICQLLGYTENELLVRDFQDVTHPEDLDADLTLMREVIAGTRDGYRMEKRYRHRDGSIVTALLTVSAARAADSAIKFFISQVQDISDHKAALSELRRRAHRDDLTGLWNRARLREEVDRHSLEPDAALLVIDIDGFKAINDRYGHAAGDRHLCDIAAVLRQLVGADDGCGRIGGDEFAILLADDGVERAGLIAQQVVEGVAELGRGTSASVGVAHRSDCGDFEDWLDQADLAMYAAKHAGGGGFHLIATSPVHREA